MSDVNNKRNGDPVYIASPCTISLGLFCKCKIVQKSLVLKKNQAPYLFFFSCRQFSLFNEETAFVIYLN